MYTCGGALDNPWGDQVEGASELKSKYDAQVRNAAEAKLLKGYRRLSVKRRQGLLAMID